MSERTENPLNDDDRMTFGKWKGVRLRDVPDHYWIWFLKQPWSSTHPRLVEYAKVVEDD